MMKMNTSCNDDGKLVPYSAFTAATPALPAFYWDVYSSEQRIKELCKELKKLADYGTYLAETIDEIQAITPDDLSEVQDAVESEIADLRNLIKSLNMTTLVWDVQHGILTSSTNAIRDMFNDVTVHAITIAKLNSLDMTVKDLADCGLNVRGLAVMSYYLVEQFDIPNDFVRTNAAQNAMLTTQQLNVAKVDTNGNVYIPEEFRF